MKIALPAARLVCRLALPALALGLAHQVHTQAQALPPQVYGITADARLVSFSAAAPGVILSSRSISGVPTGYFLTGLSRRPRTGELYLAAYNTGIGRARIYRLDTATGQTSEIRAAPLDIPLGNRDSKGFCFDPRQDRMVMAGYTDRAFWLDGATGDVLTIDSGLAYPPGDVNAGANPALGSIAIDPGADTSLPPRRYVFDDSLGIVGHWGDSGRLRYVGFAQLNFQPLNGGVELEILRRPGDTAYQAFATGVLHGGATSGLYRVDLRTGFFTPAGQIGPAPGLVLRDFALVPQADPLTANRPRTVPALHLHPNPAGPSTQLYLDQAAAPGTYLTLTDAAGRKVWQQTVEPGRQAITLPTAALAPGVYRCRLSAPGRPEVWVRLVR